MSRQNRPRGGGNRRDVKQVSKNRFAQLDADIVSAYDDDDDQPIRPQRGVVGGVGRVINHLAGQVMHGRKAQDMKKDRMNRMGAAGRNAEMVNKVKIPFGARKFSVQWIMKQLNQQIEDFKPLLITPTAKGDLEFFVKSDEAAGAVRAISRRIVDRKTGERVVFLVDKVCAPWSRLKKEEIEIINTVVDSRFNPGSRSIDLSEFALDPKFIERDLHMMLNKNNVMLAVMDRIDEKYGNVTAISLKGNRLRYLDYAAMLTSITKFVIVLDVSDNQIGGLDQLSKLKGLPVQTLFFEGNPYCEQLTKSSEYINAMHQVFPKVTRLDGQECPPCTAIMENDEDDEISNEPHPKPAFYGSAEIQVMVETFFVEYLKMYDGEDGAATRKNLMPAYDAENATFSLSFANIADSEPVRYYDDVCFNAYYRLSHNIIQQERWAKYRSTRTTKGAMEIVVLLSKLPLTNHYKESLIVDVHLQTPQLLGFTVHGLFEDGKLATAGQLPTLNYFARSFVVRPCGEGSVAVLSDMLYISGILPERMARYKLLMNKSLTLPAADPVAAVPAQIVQAGVPSEEIRQQMIEQFTRESGLRPEWSLKCLEDTNWNYELAGQQFLALREQIPKEAFISP